MPPPKASEQLYTTLQQYQLLLLTAGRRLWRRMLPGDFDGSWSRIVPQLVAFTSGAQLAAAQAAVAYVPAVLEETGQPDRPEAAVRPQAFAGVSSDGRSVSGLLDGAVVAAKRAVERGMEPSEALLGGRKWLEQALQSAVADAARDATQAEIIVRENIGFYRLVNPPCCARCAALAGAFYRWDHSFERHPQCDCIPIPGKEKMGGDLVADPDELQRRGLITDLTQAQRRRIDEGADLVKVLNESRDRWRVQMAADRRRERYARYTPAERRAADRRARARVESGEDIQTVHDFMASLTSRVQVLNAMRASGIAE